MTYSLAVVPELDSEAPRLLQLLRDSGLDVRVTSAPSTSEGTQAALRDGALDMLIVPGRGLASLEPGVWAAATLRREDPGDVFVPRESAGATLSSLAAGARIGLEGARRKALLLAHRRDLEPVALFEVPEADALGSENLDGVVLSTGEARRAGVAHRATEALDVRSWVPTPGHGIALLLCRPNDRQARSDASLADDGVAQAALLAENAASARLGLAADAPAGVLALPQGRWMRVFGLVASADGTRVVRGDVTSSAAGPAAAGTALAELLLSRGADRLLHEDVP